MRETKNHKLIKEIVEVFDILDYYTNYAQNLLQKLKNTTLTRVEEERWNTKERLMEDLESFFY